MATNFSRITSGMDVLARDGDKVGTVRSANANYVEVEQGTGLFGLFGTDTFYVPMGHVDHIEPDAIVLDTQRAELDRMDWHRPPKIDGGTTTQASDIGNAPTGSGIRFEEGTTADYPRGRMADADLDRSRSADRGEDSMELREETLRARKSDEQVGEVRLSKHIEEQTSSIDVPLTHEEVTIERRAVDRPADAEFTDEQQTIDVPVRAEEASLERRARVYEEIDVDKQDVTETEHLSGKVRREVADLETEGDVNIDRGARPLPRKHDEHDQPAI